MYSTDTPRPDKSVLLHDLEDAERQTLFGFSELARVANALERAGYPADVVFDLREYAISDEELERRVQRAKDCLNS